MFFKKDSEYLHKEKEIYNYLGKALRIFNLFSKLTSRKEKIVKQIKSLINDLYFHVHSSEDKTRILAELEQLSEILLSQIRRQERLLAQDIRISDKEEELIQDIQNMSIFAAINPYEKAVLDELVYKEKEEIRELLQILRGFFTSLQNQEQLVNNLELETRTEEEIRKNMTGFTSEFTNIFRLEKRSIDSCVRITEHLMEVSKKIIKENDIIEEAFNPEDLKEMMALVGTEIKREEQKDLYLINFLRRQRELRDPINTSQLIAVHITDYFPEDGIIKTGGHFKYKLVGVEVDYPRETIHFSLNGPVGSHMDGNWENKKYAILIPVPSIIERIINISSQDSFVVGDLPLPPGSEVLGKSKDIKGKSAGNGLLITVPDNQTIHQAVVDRIIKRGYTPMVMDLWGWHGPAKEEDAKDLVRFFGFDRGEEKWAYTFKEFAQKLEKEIGAHGGTFWGYLEGTARSAYDLLLKEITPSTYHDAEMDIISCKEQIPKLLVELYKRSHMSTTPEEKEAYLRIERILKKLYKDLKRRYPKYWSMFGR